MHHSVIQRMCVSFLSPINNLIDNRWVSLKTIGVNATGAHYTPSFCSTLTSNTIVTAELSPQLEVILSSEINITY
jgi:hypothetical protein